MHHQEKCLHLYINDLLIQIFSHKLESFESFKNVCIYDVYGYLSKLIFALEVALIISMHACMD